MFNLFKRKPKQEKIEVYKCIICKGNYNNIEDIDFFTSRREHGDMCKRCAKFINEEGNI